MAKRAARKKTGNKTAATAGRTSLDTLRTAIDDLDRRILELLAERRRLSSDVLADKKSSGVPLRDHEREGELLGKLIRFGREQGLDAHFVSSVYQHIIEDSIRLQQEHLHSLAHSDEEEPSLIRVAVQGIRGAYSYLAAQKFFSPHEERLAVLDTANFVETLQCVEEGRAEYAVLPIENTTSGSINEVYDLLLHTPLSIVGEEKLRIQHCLVGADTASLADIRTIYSHPQALTQCSNFLSTLSDCRIESFNDTAGSARKIMEDADPTQAAIASEQAAEMFNLAVLKRDIANQAENYTRFIIVARQMKEVDERIPCKTSLVMATGQKPGSLVDALLIFKDHGVNMSKLESRPVQGNPWEEMFYIDCEGNIADENVRQTLDELTRVTRYIKVLGCYPARDLAPVGPARRTAAPADGGATTQAKPAEATPPTVQAAAKPQGYKLVSRTHKAEDTVIEVGGVQLGGPNFTVIAGPCSVESLDQILRCAREVKEHGGTILRGGCFKPRTSPYSFQGLGYEGLKHLVEAGAQYGLPIITEVLTPADVHKVAERADILQVGARNMQNFSLLREVGGVHRPVMLKRGMMSSLDELLQAAEYILARGNQQVVLCERGIRTFETATRSTLDISAVPVLLARTHLPVFVDPSHAAGQRDLVAPLARAAKAIGAHGVMIEVHPEPEKALSDGPQALYFAQFEKLMGDLLA